jgi:hypothetical protein
MCEASRRNGLLLAYNQNTPKIKFNIYRKNDSISEGRNKTSLRTKPQERLIISSVVANC